MEKPNEVDAEPKHSPSFWGFIIWPAVVLMVYVLSIGPVSRFMNIDSGAPGLFYTPLFFAYWTVPPFAEAFDVYMRWWDPHWDTR
jgi:hypothetical protein